MYNVLLYTAVQSIHCVGFIQQQTIINLTSFACNNFHFLDLATPYKKVSSFTSDKTLLCLSNINCVFVKSLQCTFAMQPYLNHFGDVAYCSPVKEQVTESLLHGALSLRPASLEIVSFTYLVGYGHIFATKTCAFGTKSKPFFHFYD